MVRFSGLLNLTVKESGLCNVMPKVDDKIYEMKDSYARYLGQSLEPISAMRDNDQAQDRNTGSNESFGACACLYNRICQILKLSR